MQTAVGTDDTKMCTCAGPLKAAISYTCSSSHTLECAISRTCSNMQHRNLIKLPSISVNGGYLHSFALAFREVATPSNRRGLTVGTSLSPGPQTSIGLGELQSFQVKKIEQRTSSQKDVVMLCDALVKTQISPEWNQKSGIQILPGMKNEERLRA